MTHGRQLTAEAIGTALLIATVVGSGIMGERLAGGNDAIALLANTLATGAGLSALILTFGPISGAHFNPAVRLARAANDTFAGIRPRDTPGFIVAQLLGAAVATLLFRWLLPAEKATQNEACCAEVEVLQTALTSIAGVCTSPAWQAGRKS